MPNRSLKPVERPLALGEQVYNALRAQLRSGAIGAGQALQEVSLAEQLGVSRTPVREAMARLASEGLLAADRRSFTVPALTLQDVDDIYEVRFLVEPAALRRIAEVDGGSGAAARDRRRAGRRGGGAPRRRQRSVQRSQRALRAAWLALLPERQTGAGGRAVCRSPAAHPGADARRCRRAHRRAARAQTHHGGAGRGRRRRRRGGDARTPVAGAPRLHRGHRPGRQVRGPQAESGRKVQ